MIPPFRASACLACALSLAACAPKGSGKAEYGMGEQVALGPLAYTVIDSSWKTQLGDFPKLRIPQQRFLLLQLSLSNNGASEVSVPLLLLQADNGRSFMESEDGEGVDRWFGLLRTVRPGETQQGQILFDAPLASYRLRVTDGGGPGAEKYAWIAIQPRIDVEDQPPVPGPSGAAPR
ncbi:MAG TPA: DUF4352 domain-containing protein [Bryobacteraceae bacterium]|nr:DUF4352 domain-containing protein [Bryobacteraceae bacterium]